MTDAPQTERQRKRYAGIVLILIGLALFVLHLTRGSTEVVVFLVLGGAFLVGYFRTGRYGLLIPGCILAGLGVGALGDRSAIDFGNFEQFGLGLGFLSIFVIDAVRRGNTHWWPLIPGGVLLVTSVSDARALRFAFKSWPLILVVVGIFLLLRGRRESGSSGPPPS